MHKRTWKNTWKIIKVLTMSNASKVVLWMLGDIARSYNTGVDQKGRRGCWEAGRKESGRELARGREHSVHDNAFPSNDIPTYRS